MDDVWDFLKKQRNDEGDKTKGGVLLQPWAFLTTCRCYSSSIYKQAGRVDSGSGVGVVLSLHRLVDALRRYMLMDEGGGRDRHSRSLCIWTGLCVPAACVAYFEDVGPWEVGVMARLRREVVSEQPCLYNVFQWGGSPHCDTQHKGAIVTRRQQLRKCSCC